MRIPQPGELFEGKYKILQVLGQGGFAIVFRATDIHIGRDVAIKVLTPHEGGYADNVLSRFEREARVIAGLQDQHTITMFEFGRTDVGLLFMVFEYVRGIDLAETLKRKGALEPDVVVHIVRQLLFSLREAHGAGILHRDIKPANVLVYEYMGDSNRVKLLDFGIAKPVVSTHGGGDITREGAMVGTPRYMAPEQVFAAELSPATDIYSLGLVTYELLLGKPAIEGRTSKERIRRQIDDDALRVPEGWASAEFRAIVDRMMVREAEGRFQSVGAILAAIDLLPEGSAAAGPAPALLAPPDGPVGETLDENAGATPPAAHGSLARVGLIAVSTVALGLALLLLFGPRRGKEDPPPASLPDLSQRSTKPLVPAVEPDAGAVVVEVADEHASKDGCGKSPDFDGLGTLRLDLNLEPRRWDVYVPKGYDRNERHPVVLMFHKSTQKGRDFLEDTKFSSVADAHNIVLLAVDSMDANLAWRDVEDVTMVKQALEETNKQLCLDRSRVFAMGHGQGGQFSIDLACEIPLSAVATSGHGLHVGDEVCVSKPSTPILRLFGKTDNRVPANGGRGCLGGTFLSAKKQERMWKKRNSCIGAQETWFTDDAGECRTWECSGAPFAHCELDGGHDWPTAAAQMFELPGCSSTPADFPYGETIWKFFEEKGRKLPIEE